MVDLIWIHLFWSNNHQKKTTEQGDDKARSLSHDRVSRLWLLPRANCVAGISRYSIDYRTDYRISDFSVGPDLVGWFDCRILYCHYVSKTELVALWQYCINHKVGKKGSSMAANGIHEIVRFFRSGGIAHSS